MSCTLVSGSQLMSLPEACPVLLGISCNSYLGFFLDVINLSLASRGHTDYLTFNREILKY